jgi:hypothetical protein
MPSAVQSNTDLAKRKKAESNFLIPIEARAGHGAGIPQQIIEETAAVALPLRYRHGSHRNATAPPSNHSPRRPDNSPALQRGDKRSLQ